MYRVELYATVRRSVYVEGLSERAAARRFGLARETVRKMLRYRRPPGYRRARPLRHPDLSSALPLSATQLPDGLVFLRHGGLILLRP